MSWAENWGSRPWRREMRKIRRTVAEVMRTVEQRRRGEREEMRGERLCISDLWWGTYHHDQTNEKKVS